LVLEALDIISQAALEKDFADTSDCLSQGGIIAALIDPQALLVYLRRKIFKGTLTVHSNLQVFCQLAVTTH
jgi:hypothetical protein